MLRTWMSNDVSAARHAGDLRAALGAMKARTLVLASETDLYFTPEDCARDAAQIPGARFQTIPSIWGHRAGNPYQNPVDAMFIRNAIEELMSA